MSNYTLEQKVIATLSIEDQRQDFIEIDVLENGVILGESIMLKEGRLTMLGIGAKNGDPYFAFSELKKDGFKTDKLVDLLIYFKNSGDPDPVPWEARTLAYPIIGTLPVVKAIGTLPVVKADRFISKGKVY